MREARGAKGLTCAASLLPPRVFTFLSVYSIVVYAAVVFWLWSGANGLYLPKIGLLGGDFFNIWSAARLTLEGRVMDVFDERLFYEAQKAMLGFDISFRPWLYPLTYLPWVLGFGALSFPVALIVYLAVTFAGYVFAVTLRRPHAWTLGLALLLSPASFENFIGGQNGFWTAACFIGGLRLLWVRPALAGVLLGFLSMKPQLFLLVPLALLAGRHWRALASMALTGAVLLAISVAVLGVEPWQAYCQSTLPLHRTLIESPPYRMFMTSMAVTPFMAVRLLGGSLHVAYGFAAFFAAAAAACVVATYRRPAPQEASAAVLVAATFLASPYLLTYDMTVLSGVVLALLPRWRSAGQTWIRSFVLLVLWVLPLAVVALNENGMPIVPLVLAVFMAMAARDSAAGREACAERKTHGQA